jgi:crossover junction endodeoxyribonuclease RuvC
VKVKKIKNKSILLNCLWKLKKELMVLTEIAVVIEHVSAMPGQGVTSMFNFGQSFGVIKGICCSALTLARILLSSDLLNGKNILILIGSSKDASRTKATRIISKFFRSIFQKRRI